MLSIRQKAMRYLDPKTDKPQFLNPTNALISTLEDVDLDCNIVKLSLSLSLYLSISLSLNLSLSLREIELTL